MRTRVKKVTKGHNFYFAFSSIKQRYAIQLSPNLGSGPLIAYKYPSQMSSFSPLTMSIDSHLSIIHKEASDIEEFTTARGCFELRSSDAPEKLRLHRPKCNVVIVYRTTTSGYLTNKWAGKGPGNNLVWRKITRCDAHSPRTSIVGRLTVDRSELLRILGSRFFKLSFSYDRHIH